jgi:hypothetical protein
MDDIIPPQAPESEVSQQTASMLGEPKGKPKTFKCPACAGTVIIKAVGITINAVCSQCSSVIDVTNEDYMIVAEAHKKICATLLEIGTRGRLHNIDWEVIGYIQKTDGSGMYRWDEYLLYNPYQGFRFLVQFAGHWNFVKVLKADIAGAGFTNEVWVNDKKYALFLKGKSVVAYVKGEFYWRVRKGDRMDVADYISPPHILSIERNRQEINVSLGEYMNAEEVEAAFNIKSGMPYKEGVAANQPAPYQGKFRNIWLVASVAFAIAYALQLITTSVADNSNVYTMDVAIQPYQKDQTFGSPSFNLPKEGNVLIQSASAIQNDWVELGLSLVNEQTNEEYAVQQAIEYYYGRDSDGSWSEGKQYAETYLSNVPSGNYRLLIDVDAGAFLKGSPATFSLNVTRDVPSWSNFWCTVLLLVIYPLFTTLRRWSFEGKRWSESDYAPVIYRSSQGGDDN